MLGVECDYVDKNGDSGIDLMQRSLASFRKMGVVSLTAYMLTRLAQAYGMTGDHDTAMKLVEEGIAHSEQTGERVFEAEFFRLRGEIRRQVENNFDAARDDLNKAITIARSQGSKALELRARTSLARMEFAVGAPGEAGQLLAEILDELDEGRDAYDVVEARTLLEQNATAVG